MKLFIPCKRTTLLLVTLLLSPPAQAEFKNTAAQSRKVDQLVARKLAEQKLQPNGPISDDVFVRRAYLAIIGRIPTGPEAAEFLSRQDQQKRDQLIEKLLNSEGYVSHFYNYWADILRINSRLGRSGASNEYAYKHWVKESLRGNKPYDQMVFEMVAADGNIWENGATGYYHRDRGMPLDNMANTVRIFLGTRLECAQCHDHPFDKWKQTDFFHMASFTYGVRTGYDQNADARRALSEEQRAKMRQIAEEVSGIKGFYPTRRERDIDRIYEKDDRRSMARRRGIATIEEYKAINKKVLAALAEYEVENRAMRNVLNDIYNPLRYASMTARDRDSKLPHDYQYDDAKPNEEMKPSPMFGGAISAEELEKEGYLPAYARWMTSKENPRFTTVIANRLWKKVFGVGLIEPVDQITDYTEPYNAELLTYLERCMKEFDYDMKSFLAMLLKTESWQRAAHTEEIAIGSPYYFPGPALQRMSAEQIWDSVITLIIPDADHYQPSLGRELQAIDRDRKIHEALESRSSEEFRAMVEKLAGEVKVSYAKQEQVRLAYNQARKDEDEQRVRELSRELRSLTGDLRRTISRVAYNGADGRTRDMDALMAGAGMMAGGERYVNTSLPRVKPKMPAGLSRQEQKQWQRDQRTAASTWGRTVRNVMRASELPTPAPRGHFLREFGQSDRELIENASDSASVPQALNLMNSGLADQLAHPYSVLGQALTQCDSPTEEIKTIYQLMLTRQPTESEIERLLGEYQREPKKARGNIIWALLNTQQFIFNL